MAEHVSLTKTVLDRLPAGGSAGRPPQYFVKDTKQKGFGVRVGRRRITFVVFRGKKAQPEKLGLYPAEFTVEEAHKKARERLNAEEPASGTLTLDEAITRTVDKLRQQGRRPATLGHYTGALRSHLADWLERPIRRITEEDVLARHKELGPKRTKDCSDGQKRETGGLVLADQVMKLLKKVLKMHRIRPNPVDVLSETTSWNNAKKRGSAVAEKDLSKLCEAIEGLADAGTGDNGKELGLWKAVGRDFLKLCLYTGLRSHEARCLRWDQVDQKRRTITIPASVAKNGQELVLPITRQVAALLKIRRKENQVLCPEPEDARRAYVFPNAELVQSFV